MKMFCYLGTVVLMILFTACGSDKKDNAPELTVTFPTSTTSFGRAGDFTFSGVVSDDVELKMIRFALSYKSGLKGIEQPWEPAEDVRQIAGKEKSFDNDKLFKEQIPYDSKAGVYTLLVEVTDKGGKTTSKTIEVTID
jgi:hypothetical protein